MHENVLYAMGSSLQSPFCSFLLTHVMCAANVVSMQKEPGQTYSKDDLKAALEQHKPAVLFLTQVPHVTELALTIVLGVLAW